MIQPYEIQSNPRPRSGSRLLVIAALHFVVSMHFLGARVDAAGTPVVARVEMRLSADDTVDVIEKGDLLTVLQEREDDYVIVTHDGTRGAVDKVNAVKIAESVDVYTELIDANPEEGRYHTLRASAYWALGKTAKAVEDFDQAIELGYEKSHAYTSRGLFHAEMGNFDDAIADYDRAMELEPDSISPLINRAAVHTSRGDFAAAIQDYDAILERKPESASILHQRAIANKLAGKHQAAIEDFSTLITNNSDDRTAVMGRGYVFFGSGQFAKAVEDFGRGIELDQTDAVAWNNRGYNLAQLGQWSKAITDYEQAIELLPTYALAHQNLAWALTIADDESLTDSTRAIQSAREAAKLNNHQNVSDLAALAAALAMAGEWKEAVGWQEKVVEMIDANFRPFAQTQLQRYRDEMPFLANPPTVGDEDSGDKDEPSEPESDELAAK